MARLASVSPPWDRRSALVAGGATLFGAVLLVAGWSGMRGRGSLDDQLAWLALAIIGSLCAGVGQATWLLYGRRRIGMARRTLLGPVARHDHTSQPVTADLVSIAADPRRFHRSSCLLVRGKPTIRVSRPDPGAFPCGVCQP